MDHHFPLRDVRELQDFALSHCVELPDMLREKAFRQLKGGWAVGLSVNR